MKPFTTATAIILAVVAIAHALRLGLGWSVNAGGIDAARGSFVACAVSCLLCTNSY